MKGLDFYASRADKAYSLVDYISMDTMRPMGLTCQLDTFFVLEALKL
jgi:hypothetical protein